METVEYVATLAMDMADYDEAEVRAKLAQLYGIAADRTERDARPTAPRPEAPLGLAGRPKLSEGC